MRHFKFLNMSFTYFRLYFGFTFITFLNVLCNYTVEAKAHVYLDLKNGDEFPEWGGLCEEGKRQSPISLSDDDPLIYKKLRELTIKGSHFEQKKAIIKNLGHTIRITNFSAKMVLSGGPLLYDYIVEYIEFRWWAEHSINYMRYPLECQIFCRNKLYKNLDAALQHNDGVTIVAVLYHAAPIENAGLKNIIEYIDEIQNNAESENSAEMKMFKLLELVPHLSSFYTYGGSLTTPPCTETVTWIVLKETFPVDWYQLKMLKEIEFDRGMSRKNNFRYRQRKNNRTVVFVDNDLFWNGLSGCDRRRKITLTLLSIILVLWEQFL